jgi:Flp pilus assembly protein protease CpaA
MAFDPMVIAIWVGALGSMVLAITDLWWRRIPNAIVYPLLLAVPVFVLWRTVAAGHPGPAIDALLGFVVIGGLWLGIFLFGGCGGGDVKLMAANGGLLGLALGLFHLCFALFAAVAYLFLILLVRFLVVILPLGPWPARFLASHRTVMAQGSGVNTSAARQRSTVAIPFAVPIALGYLPLLEPGLRSLVLSWF